METHAAAVGRAAQRSAVQVIKMNVHHFVTSRLRVPLTHLPLEALFQHLFFSCTQSYVTGAARHGATLGVASPPPASAKRPPLAAARRARPSGRTPSPSLLLLLFEVCGPSLAAAPQLGLHAAALLGGPCYIERRAVHAAAAAAAVLPARRRLVANLLCAALVVLCIVLVCLLALGQLLRKRKGGRRSTVGRASSRGMRGGTMAHAERYDTAAPASTTATMLCSKPSALLPARPSVTLRSKAAFCCLTDAGASSQECSARRLPPLARRKNACTLAGCWCWCWCCWCWAPATGPAAPCCCAAAPSACSCRWRRRCCLSTARCCSLPLLGAAAACLMGGQSGAVTTEVATLPPPPSETCGEGASASASAAAAADDDDDDDLRRIFLVAGWLLMICISARRAPRRPSTTPPRPTSGEGGGGRLLQGEHVGGLMALVGVCVQWRARSQGMLHSVDAQPHVGAAAQAGNTTEQKASSGRCQGGQSGGFLGPARVHIFHLRSVPSACRQPSLSRRRRRACRLACRLACRQGCMQARVHAGKDARRRARSAAAAQEQGRNSTPQGMQPTSCRRKLPTAQGTHGSAPWEARRRHPFLVPSPAHPLEPRLLADATPVRAERLLPLLLLSLLLLLLLRAGARRRRRLRCSLCLPLALEAGPVLLLLLHHRRRRRLLHVLAALLRNGCRRGPRWPLGAAGRLRRRRCSGAGLRRGARAGRRRRAAAGVALQVEQYVGLLGHHLALRHLPCTQGGGAAGREER